jgi:aspartate kinase
MRLVMKFGGGLLTSGAGVRDSALLVKERLDQGHQVVCVTSALGGVTDRLLKVVESTANPGEDEAHRVLQGLGEDLRRQHLQVAREAGVDEDLDELTSTMAGVVEHLQVALRALASGDQPARRRDEIVAVGEMLSTPTFASALSAMGAKARPLTGGEAGIVTDSNHGKALPVMASCETRVRDRLGPLLAGGVSPVVTGFIAQDADGAITTLGRGGSDYTASILGACLEADEIWIWKDVGGVMTADPKLVPRAGTIPALSYSEAAELAHFGATVLHPRTMSPAMKSEIPIRVRGVANADQGGTLISGRTSQTPGSVKAVTSTDGVGLIAVSCTGMAGVPGVAARVFESLARGDVNVMMISQGSSETNITMVVPGADIGASRRLLEEEFRNGGPVGETSLAEDIAIVSVVGSGMRGTPGVAARVFKAVAEVGVNVMMISQGSSELNISFVVGREDSGNAVASIHREFKLDDLSAG